LIVLQGFSLINYAREGFCAQYTRARGKYISVSVYVRQGSILHTNTTASNEVHNNMLIDWPHSWPMIDFKWYSIHKRNKTNFLTFNSSMTLTVWFHKMADEGDKINSMRYSKPRYRLLSAAHLAILVRLKEIKKVFYNQKIN
jgi:hypothetical protein